MSCLLQSIAIGVPIILSVAKTTFTGSPNIRSRGPDTPSKQGANKQQQQQQLNPQPGTFAAAWYTVYIAMGLASWLIWKQGGLQAQALCLTLYVAQLCLNITAWPPVFVGGHTRKYAIADASALFGTSFATMASFYRIHQAAGLLMLPYLFWACYAAAAINYSLKGSLRGSLKGSLKGSLRGSEQTPNINLRNPAERPVAHAASQSNTQSVIHSEATTSPSGPTSAPIHPNSALPNLYKSVGKTGSGTDTMQNINTELAAGIPRIDPFAGQVAQSANYKQFVKPQHAQGTHSTDQVQPPSTPEKPSDSSELRRASDTPPHATDDQGLAEPQAAAEHADNPQGGIRGLAGSTRSVQTEEDPIANQTAPNPRDLDTSVRTDSISPSFFSDPGANGVQLRDADYLDGKKKEVAGKPVFWLSSVNLLEMSSATEHIARFLPSITDSKAPFTFVVQFMVPGKPLYSLTCAWSSRYNPVTEVEGPGADGDTDSDAAFARCLARFVKGDSKEDVQRRNKAFKLIPSVSEGGWMVRRAVGKSPVLIGSKLTTTCFRGRNYFEVDVDVGSSKVATSVCGMVQGALLNLTLDMAITLEGHSEVNSFKQASVVINRLLQKDELPEALLGAVRLQNLDLSQAAVLDSESGKISKH